MKMKVYLPGLLVMLLLLTACERQPAGAVGQLVSDRIEITAEAAEPITGIRVTEGDQVEVGQVLLTQNDERIEARLAEAEANIRRIEALLAAKGRTPDDATLAEMDALWDQAKAEERTAADE